MNPSHPIVRTLESIVFACSQLKSGYVHVLSPNLDHLSNPVLSLKPMMYPTPNSQTHVQAIS